MEFTTLQPLWFPLTLRWKFTDRQVSGSLNRTPGSKADFWLARVARSFPANNSHTHNPSDLINKYFCRVKLRTLARTLGTVYFALPSHHFPQSIVINFFHSGVRFSSTRSNALNHNSLECVRCWERTKERKKKRRRACRSHPNDDFWHNGGVLGGVKPPERALPKRTALIKLVLIFIFSFRLRHFVFQRFIKKRKFHIAPVPEPVPPKN